MEGTDGCVLWSMVDLALKVSFLGERVEPVPLFSLLYTKHEIYARTLPWVKVTRTLLEGIKPLSPTREEESIPGLSSSWVTTLSHHHVP